MKKVGVVWMMLGLKDKMKYFDIIQIKQDKVKMYVRLPLR